MATHDCQTCGGKDTCALVSIAPWLNEHEVETEQAMHDCSHEVGLACRELLVDFPLASRCKESILHLAVACFWLGYHKGKTYQDVPQAIKDSMG